MATPNDTVEGFRTAVTEAVRANWLFFLIEGIILLVLGMAAIVMPAIATLAIELTVGWVIFFSGLAGLVMTFRTRASPGFGWSLLSAVVAIAAGIVLLIWPLSGVFSLTLILTFFLLAEGITSVMYALAHQREQTPRWGFMLFSGIVDLVLSAMIFWGFPSSATWIIGLLVGIDMIFGGTALIAIALQAHADATRIPANTVKR
jgi:uncharacterized membrane protein HdeD (DUF308 family)